MYCVYGTHAVIPTCFMVWGVGFVSLLPRGHVCQISGVWGFYFFGVVLVMVMTITWPGACACLNLLPKRRFCEPYISVLVGHGLWVLLGCDMIFFFF